MKTINLKDSIELFGLKDGLSFWCSWEIKQPIQQFIFLNITHKPYCLECGWYCKKGCNEKKIYKKKEILVQWEDDRKEMESVESYKNNLCIYCNKEKGTEVIPNPNANRINNWLVCRDCKETIETQKTLTLGIFLKNKEVVDKANEKLIAISKRTGKPIFTSSIFKDMDGKYKSSSITFDCKES